MIVPPALTSGSVVRVIAPASPFDAALLWRGMGWLAERYRVRWSRAIFSRDGFLAGSDARRKAELAAALTEPDVAAILCARGGYGVSRYVHEIDFSVLAAAPRWICGFSDVTAIHVEALRAGVASMHCANVTGVGRGDAVLRDGLIAALEGHASQPIDGLRVLAPGDARGTLAGGNLTLIHACAAAGRLRLPEPCILVIEDVTEMPYRIDRMLTTLRVGGHLDSVSGVVVGEMTRCAPGRDGVTVDQVLARTLLPLGVPVITDLGVGHGRRNLPLVLGAQATISDGRLSVA